MNILRINYAYLYEKITFCDHDSRACAKSLGDRNRKRDVSQVDGTIQPWILLPG